MYKSNPNSFNLPPKSTTANSRLTQKQLIDSLASHISLYHSHSLNSGCNRNPNSNYRASILKWFSALTVHQRQAHLTTVDVKFTQLLIQMLGKVRTQGCGVFIVLPDIPSSDPPHLPSLCYKRSRGLLSRVAESNESERLIFESTWLFGSREGEKIEECSCSINCLDSVTVSEDFIENVDHFVAAMDKVSNGRFLRGQESELGSDWVELEWLKDKGYYSLEDFVASRLEVALRLAWLSCSGGKKRGVKLKEKVIAAGVAANVFWRKKGCVDWWRKLDLETRRKLSTVALGKAAKFLTLEISKGKSSVMMEEMWSLSAGVEQASRYKCSDSSRSHTVTNTAYTGFGLSIKPPSGHGKSKALIEILNQLIVLQDVLSLVSSCWHSDHNIGKVFFTTLGCLGTTSDCVLRKMRALIMVISLDCMKIELLEEDNSKSLPTKSKEKLSSCSKKKKGRTHNMKKLNPGAGSGADDFLSDKPFKEHDQRMVVGKERSTARKCRKEKKKSKSSGFKNPTEVKNSTKSVATGPSSSVSSAAEAAKAASAHSTVQTVSDEKLNVGNIVEEHLSVRRSSLEPPRGYIFTESIQEDCSCRSTEDLCHGGTDYNQVSGILKNHTTLGRLGISSCNIDSDVISAIEPALELDSVSTNVDASLDNLFPSTKLETKADFMDKSVRAMSRKEEPLWIQEQETENIYVGVGHTSASAFISYEWPSVAPVFFPSINPHIPAATDRLHLDVGHNWHNHIRQPFVPTMHQARNARIEVGCSPIFPRPLPMSLDWPPMVRNNCGLAPSFTYNYDPGFIARRQSAFQPTFSGQNYMKALDNEKYSGDSLDLTELANMQELAEECDSHWLSEEEFEVHAVSGIDYNQHFGGGVMYWNPSDHPGTSFSRPPSLSSDDSSWAWREADMKRAVDDMVAFSSSYSTNGLTSPTAASFCSAFDPLGPGHQALGYVAPANDVHGKVLHSSTTIDAVSEDDVSGCLSNISADIEGKPGDSLPYPILRPIIIPNLSREGSRSDFKRNHDHKSPCLPTSRREQQRIKRPPSPVVLGVPRAPRLPPPSPVSDSRKHRGFPTVRSGSSSPRHWGMRGWNHEGTNLEEACTRVDGAEVVWPSWRNKSLSGCTMIQPLSGSLLQDRLIAMSQLTRDQEHPDVALPLQPPELQCATRKASLSLMYSLLHNEIDSFCKQVAAENMGQKPYINWAVKRVTRSLQVLWPRSRTNIFGSNATGLALPTSDVDLVVCLPPVRNLEPIKEAGILEGRNGIKETCLQHAARYLANQEWVKTDSLKTVENTAIPIIMLMVEVPRYLIASAVSNVQSPKEEPTCLTCDNGNNNTLSGATGFEDSASPKCSQSNDDNLDDVKSVRIDISFKSPSHTGLQTTELVKELTEQFPAATPLALVLKQFLADRSLDRSYSGGLSSYCLVILITRFLQHVHHLGKPINQNFGSLLMDFLYFFGNVFDPRQMRISVQGSGVYIKRERGHSIDPIHIDDPLFPMNNVGRNCFRIHQCIKAFSEAYSILETELTCLPDDGDTSSVLPPYRLLSKIIASINLS
ncbi:uncharacterized protein LOC119982767 isoform X2 [Tripterygium wilfordii]|uniref:uncharacterized protein LOC119982767 isoform X2 n=1 Tax=Tripterygium wilfordii TaxID=458696 RepID=UPI0018F7EDF3|nr:uncharacterized protein LOC119982767 isoform X2 [Tripterygium wilfordii]